MGVKMLDLKSSIGQLIVIVGISLIITGLFNMAYNDEQAFESQYCKDVQTWEASKHVNPYDRPGHPNYRNLECE